MTACTDDERRLVARMLRELPGDTTYPDLIGVIADHDGWYPASDAADRLADLIEPSIPEDPGEAGLACVDAFIREHTEKPVDRDTPQKMAEEMFGKMRHTTKEEADAYDAMLKSKSVEIHPVDRGALLRLARYMDKDVAETEAHFSNVISTKSVSDYAQRIREALGVES